MGCLVGAEVMGCWGQKCWEELLEVVGEKLLGGADGNVVQNVGIVREYIVIAVILGLY
jgi:hypothetical protein